MDLQPHRAGNYNWIFLHRRSCIDDVCTNSSASLSQTCLQNRTNRSRISYVFRIWKDRFSQKESAELCDHWTSIYTACDRCCSRHSTRHDTVSFRFFSSQHDECEQREEENFPWRNEIENPVEISARSRRIEVWKGRWCLVLNIYSSRELSPSFLESTIIFDYHQLFSFSPDHVYTNLMTMISEWWSPGDVRRRTTETQTRIFFLMFVFRILNDYDSRWHNGRSKAENIYCIRFGCLDLRRSTLAFWHFFKRLLSSWFHHGLTCIITSTTLLSQSAIV